MARATTSKIKLPLKITITVIAVTAIAGLFIRLFGFKDAGKVENIEHSLQQLRASFDTETDRVFHLQKMMRIIAEYNPEMSSSVRYEIADELYALQRRYANLDADLLCALITVETSGTWNPELVSKNGAMGLMQLLPAIAVFVAYYENISWQAPEEVLLDPLYNIRIGARYLSTLVENYDVDGGLAAYECGPSLAASWIRGGRHTGVLPERTRRYLTEIIALYREFQKKK